MITTQSNLLRERAISNVTVEGTGVLAAQIALQAAYHDFKVIAYDINVAVPEKARARFKGLQGTTCARRRVRLTANIQPMAQCQPGQSPEERRPFDRSCSRKHGVEEAVPQPTRMQFAAINLRLREWNRSSSHRVMRTPAHRDLCMLQERL
jgi:hypothetical protein